MADGGCDRELLMLIMGHLCLESLYTCSSQYNRELNSQPASNTTTAEPLGTMSARLMTKVSHAHLTLAAASTLAKALGMTVPVYSVVTDCPVNHITDLH
jgi:hypothetical protein